MPDDRLHVFISSRMHELRDLRATLHDKLKGLDIAAFVYETDQSAHPDDPESISLAEVERTDIFVLVIGDSHGAITEREYDRARELNKPCLVYERLGRMTTDPELELFIKKLSGARGVPSRTSFQTAVDLATRVSQDVQAWLMREYRRLSAAQRASNQSSRRHSALGQSIQRLSATTNRTLPQGTSADLLAWQLQQWFEAVEYPLDREPEVHSHYTDLVIRVPARRKQYTRVLVRARDGEIQSPHVDAARAVALAQSLDEVWLVTLRRITPAAHHAASQAKNIFLYTLDDLIEDDVDFSTYFEWLDKEVKTAQIDQLYVPLAVVVNEIDPSGTAHAESTYDDLSAYVDRWLEDNDGEHLSVLGEFGTGKSWFTLKYAHDLVQKYREAQQRGLSRPRVPLVVRLREYARGFKDVASLLTEFVFREHQINVGRFAALEALNRMGRLLFIFDGFDEMAARVDQQKMVDNFWALAGVLGPGAKAILTCRTEYFQFAKQARAVLSGSLRASAMKDVAEHLRFQVATLQMLDEPRLRRVLSRRSSDSNLIDSVLSNPTLVDLGRRPVMVDLLIEALPDLNTETADLAHVYYKAVHRKMDRDIVLGRTFTSMADKVYFMCEMSWEMLLTGRPKIHYKEIPDRIRDYFGFHAGTVEEDHWRHDLLSQTMLVRDDDGYYRPAHKSLVEFFSAYKLAAAIGALKSDYLDIARARKDVLRTPDSSPQTWSAYFRRSTGAAARLDRFVMESDSQLTDTWGHLALNNALSEMIVALCGREALLSALRSVNSLSERSGVIAARVLEVASFHGDLSNANLAGCVIQGCRLHHCKLVDAALTDSVWSHGRLELVELDRATLRGAMLRDMELIDVTLRGADLTNCRFEGTTDIRVNVLGAAWCERAEEEEMLLCVLADGRVCAVRPVAATVVGLESQAVAKEGPPDRFLAWLANHGSAFEVAPLGTIRIVGGWWRAGSYWIERRRSDGIVASYTTTTAAYGDVEILELRVSVKNTEETLLERQIVDATALGSPGTRLLSLATGGRKLAAISGLRNEPERAYVLGAQQNADLPLVGFAGKLVVEGPDTIDTRGAAFSGTDSLLAICERPNIVAFWRTADGAFIGRVIFFTAASDAVIGDDRTLPMHLVDACAEPWHFDPTP